MKTLPIGGNEVISLPAYNVISSQAVRALSSDLATILAIHHLERRRRSQPIRPSAHSQAGPGTCCGASRPVPFSYDIATADFPAVTSAIEASQLFPKQTMTLCRLPSRQRST